MKIWDFVYQYLITNSYHGAYFFVELPHSQKKIKDTAEATMPKVVEWLILLMSLGSIYWPERKQYYGLHLQTLTLSWGDGKI